MKAVFAFLLAMLFGAAIMASPVAMDVATNVATNVTVLTSTATELADRYYGGDKCPVVVMLFAGDLVHEGNIGRGCGLSTAQGIKELFGSDRVRVQGIDTGPAMPEDPKAWKESHMINGARSMVLHARMVNILCPETKMIAGGHGLGSGVVDATISQLEPKVLARVVAAFMYGTDKHWVFDGSIYGYPDRQTKIFELSDKLDKWYPSNEYDKFGPYVPNMVEWLTDRLRCSGVALANETSFEGKPLYFEIPDK